MEIDLILSTIHKMLTNKDPYENILEFLDNTMLPIQMDILKKSIMECKDCQLHNDNNHLTFEGDIYSDIMIVGDIPGHPQEIEGKVFAGESGIIFDRMLENAAIKINRRWLKENLFITNIIHCRPYRPPNIQEIAICKKFIDKQIELIKPKVIICIGEVAASILIHPNFNIAENHGKLYNDSPKLIALNSPDLVLQKGEKTREGKDLKIGMWNDIQVVENFLNG